MGLLDALFSGGQQQAAPQQPQAPQQDSGGGIGDFLSRIGPAIAMIDPRNQQLGSALMAANIGRQKDRKNQQAANQTAQWLQTQGVGAGESAFLSSNPDALNAWYKEWKTGDTPNWQFRDLTNPDGTKQTYMVDMNNPDRKKAVDSPYNPDVVSKAAEEQKIRIAQAGAAKNIGTPPAGYRVKYGADGNPESMEPIPGGPADKSAATAAAADSQNTASDTVTGAYNRIHELAKNPRSTGPTGALMESIPIFGQSTDAAELQRQVDVLKSNATIGNLQAMRAASPTGGALGAVSDRENTMLAAKAGALDPRSPYFDAQLDDYTRTLLRTIHGKEAGDKIFEASKNGSATAGDPAATSPAGKRVLQQMTNPQPMGGAGGWTIEEVK